MKLLIKETCWWALHQQGEKVTDFEYNLDDIQKGDKVVVRAADKENNKPYLSFILVRKGKDEVKIKLESCLILSSNRPRTFFMKLFKKRNSNNRTFSIREGEPLLLQDNDMDAGRKYSMSLKK